MTRDKRKEKHERLLIRMHALDGGFTRIDFDLDKMRIPSTSHLLIRKGSSVPLSYAHLLAIDRSAI